MDYHTINKPQSQRDKAREDQVQNDAGGYVFGITPQQQLDRFLMLGTLKGTYYANAKELTVRNLDVIKQLIEDDYKYVVDRVVEISRAGRAPKNDPALYVLAMVAACNNEIGRVYALMNAHEVARTATHLFKFLNYVQSMRGWGRALKDAVGDWYTRKNDHQLLYQVLKYRNREGWTHKDVLRKAHPVPKSAFQNDLFKWITSDEIGEYLYASKLFVGYNKVQKETDAVEIADDVIEYHLTREMIPNQHLKNPLVMQALLQDMPLTALLRNLANMAGIGLLVPGNWDVIETVCAKLSDEEAIKKARIHPLSVYQALRIYENGSNRNYRWEPVGRVVEELNDTFYKSFHYVEGSGKRFLLGLDVSGSMSQGTSIEGVCARDASAVMAMSLVHSEPRISTMAFASEFQNFNLHKRMSLNEVVTAMRSLNFGRTDCALPMIHALNNGMEIDTFVIFTDNETWCGKVHPYEALNTYRKHTGIDAKLIVCAMTSTEFSIADPNDAGMLDIVGLDTNVPALITEFSK